MLTPERKLKALCAALTSRDRKLREIIAAKSPELDTLTTAPATRKPVYTHEPPSNHHNGIRVESRRSHVRSTLLDSGSTLPESSQLTV